MQIDRPGRRTRHVGWCACRPAVASVTAILIGLIAAPIAIGAPAWNRVPVRARAGLTYALSGELDAVSCPTATMCLAVGSQTSPDGSAAAAVQLWNGASWSPRSAAIPRGATLTGVSCSAVDACTLVGFTGPVDAAVSFAERWNGSTWSKESTPTPAAPAGAAITTADLFAISCPTATTCVAVGTANTADTRAPYAEIWNGVTWRPESIPGPPTALGDAIDAVSCSSATNCEAVGNNQGYVPGAYADSWNGSTWSLQVVAAAPTGTSNAILDSVSCPTVEFCVAVGNSTGVNATTGQPYSEVWNGADWTLETMPSTAGIVDAGGSLFPGSPTSVSCTSPTNCTFTANSSAGNVDVWNGASWTRQTAVPARLGLLDAAFDDVSCVATTCVAVGTNTGQCVVATCVAVGGNTAHGEAQGVAVTDPPLAEVRRLGTWELDSPQRTAPDGVALRSVSCTSPRACIAVGSPAHGGVVAERWDGRSWSLQGAPSPPDAWVQAISCASMKACVLVGSQASGILIEWWNGRTWSLQTASAGAQYTLAAVSCTSASACMAVGGNDGSVLVTEHWNGARWSSESVPFNAGPGRQSAMLTGVSCSSRTHCTAVGTYYVPNEGAPGQTVTIADGWDGRRWTAQEPSQQTALSAVSCPSRTTCNAIAQQSSGRRWSLGPNPHALLSSIDCTAATSCIAVGSGRIESWNGVRWSPESPARRLPLASFDAVWCGSQQDCVLVGSTPNVAGLAVPLVERSS